MRRRQDIEASPLPSTVKRVPPVSMSRTETRSKRRSWHCIIIVTSFVEVWGFEGFRVMGWV